MTTEQLSVNRGIAYCRYCSVKFDALELLSDKSLEPVDKQWLTAPLPWESSTNNQRSWLVGIVVNVLLLAAQLIYFEGRQLSQQTVIRTYLEPICQTLGCQLPAYRNLDALLLQANLTRNEQHYIATVAVINQAAFAQAYPGIKLKLLDFNGKAFAERTFIATDYLTATEPVIPALKAGGVLSFRLPIAAPKQTIGGYTFELVN